MATERRCVLIFDSSHYLRLAEPQLTAPNFTLGGAMGAEDRGHLNGRIKDRPCSHGAFG